MCVCIYLCVYVCIYVYMCVCVYVCMCVCLCVYVCAYMWIYLCVCECACVHAHRCVHMCLAGVCVWSQYSPSSFLADRQRGSEGVSMAQGWVCYTYNVLRTHSQVSPLASPAFTPICGSPGLRGTPEAREGYCRPREAGPAARRPAPPRLVVEQLCVGPSGSPPPPAPAHSRAPFPHPLTDRPR